MKTVSSRHVGAFLLFAGLFLTAVPVVAQPFSYQGQLLHEGMPVNGSCDFRFSLWSAESSGNGTQFGSTKETTIDVTGGLFTAYLNASQFGDSWYQQFRNVYLEVGVSCPESSTPSYTTLPRQLIRAEPFALRSLVATQLSTVTGDPGLKVVPPVSCQDSDCTKVNVLGGTGPYRAAGLAMTRSGGSANYLFSDYSTIGGGINNRAGQEGLDSDVTQAATVAGGQGNDALGKGATVGGGTGNQATGWYSTVPGGVGNEATNEYTFAAGHNASAIHVGSFVWSDSAGGTPIVSNTHNSFTVRAVGGVRMITSANNSVGAVLQSGSGTWSSMSDRNLKENYHSVDGRSLLDRLDALPVRTWNYTTQDPATRHIGPTAQDFHAAFGVGEDDTHISAVDADGVAMAAIQTLHGILKEKDIEIANLERRLVALEKRLSANTKGQPEHDAIEP